MPPAVPLLMTDSIPLRRATDLPEYVTAAASKYLPWVFGRATVSPVPLDTTGTEWLVADHPIVGVDRVTVSGKTTSGWQLQQKLDVTGVAVSIIRLAQPTITEPVTVTVLGRKHPVRGSLLTSPGDIVRELMRLCAHNDPADSWSGLDENYRQIELGLVFDAPQLLRSAIASVIEPLHAVWRPLWAAPRAPGAPVATLNILNTRTISVRAENTGRATVGRVTYAFNWATGAASGAIRLASADALARWGELPVDIPLPAVRKARDALAFATLALADSARAAWVVTADVDARVGAIKAGQTIQLDHPHVPPGLASVTAVTHDREQDSLHVLAILYVESPPKIIMQRQSTAIDQSTATTPSILYKDGTATFTVSDDQGNPLAGATVTLDGIQTSDTNAAGQVQFKTTRGQHTLTVSMSGFAAFEINVVV